MEAVQRTNKPSPRRLQQRSVRTQKKLLDAALEAFSEHGFKGTSTRDIAKRAGVHHPLITYHFKNKGELWRAAINRVFATFVTAMQQARDASSNQDLHDRMASMIRAYVHYAASNPALHKLMLLESSHASDRLDWLVKTHLKPLCDTVVRYLVPLQERGIVPAGDPALLFNLIRVSSGGILALSLEITASSGIDLSQTEKADELADMIVRIFLPGGSPVLIHSVPEIDESP